MSETKQPKLTRAEQEILLVISAENLQVANDNLESATKYLTTAKDMLASFQQSFFGKEQVHVSRKHR